MNVQICTSSLLEQYRRAICLCVKVRSAYLQTVQETDHEALIKSLQHVGLAIDLVVKSRGSGLTELKILSKYVAKYKKNMLPHLLEEEETALPLMRAFFEPREINPTIQKIIGKMPPVMIGSFWYRQTDEECKQFMKQEGIPFFVFYVAVKPAKAVYETEVMTCVNAIVRNEEPAPKPDRSTRCFANYSDCMIM